ncbi:hypothetical protein GCM10025871_23720 [Deinococcus metallilatus]|nr:hypothetical protein GCM10025871_23720 [Deinococcus metallilatus]
MALRQGLRWGVLERSVAEQVRRMRTPKPELEVWTPQQARAFLAVAEGAPSLPAVRAGAQHGVAHFCLLPTFCVCRKDEFVFDPLLWWGLQSCEAERAWRSKG